MGENAVFRGAERVDIALSVVGFATGSRVTGLQRSGHDPEKSYER